MTGETVLLGSFAHETNTFDPTPTDHRDFRYRREVTGDDVVETFRGSETTLGGVVDAADEAGLTLVPTVAAKAMPGGSVTGEMYEFYVDRIVAAAGEHADRLDGVVLVLHGAMVPEGGTDGEGPLVERVSEAVGPDVPVAVTLDLHANVSDRLLAAADLVVACRTHPHVDLAETGRRATRLLAATMRGDVDPVMAVERPPVLARGPAQDTTRGPLAAVMARAEDLESRDGVLAVSAFPGFDKADVPDAGFSVVVVADGDRAVARDAARDLAELVWERRELLVPKYLTPRAAVAEARRLLAAGDAEDGPVVLADVGDDPGGGAPGDGTVVLRELLAQDLTNAGFAIVCDPEVVAAAVAAGVGERVTVDLGGKTDDLHGDPIRNLDARVAAVTDGEFVYRGPMVPGTPANLGRTVRLQCGRDDGVAVVVTENARPPVDTELWRHVGVQPERLDVVVVKSTNHYRADYGPMASHVLPVDSPGLTAANADRFEYENVRRPLFPLDAMADDDYPDWT